MAIMVVQLPFEFYQFTNLPIEIHRIFGALGVLLKRSM